MRHKRSNSIKKTGECCSPEFPTQKHGQKEMIHKKSTPSPSTPYKKKDRRGKDSCPYFYEMKEKESSRHTRAYVRTQLARDTPEKRAARASGNIRVFLALVAMSPSTRNQVASYLGWSTYVQASFGDPHREAAEILNARMTGFVARATKSRESINPAAATTNWYEVMQRVSETVFHHEITRDVSSSQMSQALQSNSDEAKTLVRGIQDEFLGELAKHIKSTLPESRLAGIESLLRNERVTLLAEHLHQLVGIASVSSLSYCYNFFSELRSGPQVVVTEGLMNTLGVVGDVLGTVASPTIHGVSHLVGTFLPALIDPTFVIGIIGLSYQIIDHFLGSSEAQLLMPMLTIFNTLLVLALPQPGSEGDPINLELFFE